MKRRRRASRRVPTIFVEGLESRRLLSISVSTFDDVVDASDGVISLREAVALAAQTPGADVVVAPHEIGGVEGVYALELGQLTIDDADPLTIRSDGGTAVIDAQSASRVFEVAAGSDVVLDGLTITGGYEPDPNTGSGAGVWNKGSIQITDCLFSGNAAGFLGGGLFNDLGTAVVSETVFDSNTATYGGGLSNNSALTVTGGVFRNNYATQGSGGLDNIGAVSVSGALFEGNVGVYFGGGFHSYGGFEGFSGATEIVDCTFRDNSSPSGSGGGVDLYAVDATITGTVFEGNTVLSYGGGISMSQVEGTFDGLTFDGNSADTGGGISTSSNLTLTDSSFQNNSAFTGGGLANAGFVSIAGSSFVGNTGYYGGGISSGGTVVVEDSTFEGNNASSGNGGGINNGGGTLTVTGGSFAGNAAGYGGGVYSNGSAEFEGVSFTGNAGDYGGGGVYAAYGATIAVSDGVFQGNVSLYGVGGGVYLYDVSAVIADTAFEGNWANNGGGIYSYYGTTTITGSGFTANSAAYYGGGLFLGGGAIQFSGCEVEENSASYGGGLFLEYIGNGVVEANRIHGNSASIGGGILQTGYGLTRIDGNEVSGNVGSGIVLQGYDVSVLGNTITGNTGDGIRIDWGAYNTIGAPGDGNTIVDNTGAGVSLTGYPYGNSIRGNVIHSNGGLAIDLGGDGRTENDPGDYDGGPNNLQNFPVVNGFTTGASTRVVGYLNSQPGSSFTIDVYADATGGSVNPGEGSRYLGSFEVVTDSLGYANFDVTLAVATAPGEVVTATATDPYGNTSEFSTFLPIQVTPVAGLATSESGVQAKFSVVLSVQPTADVTIPLSSSDATEGVVSQSSLTFTPANWNVPQVVTVTGVDDSDVDGPIAYTIVTGPATSADPIYDGLDAPDVQVVNYDDEFTPLQPVEPAGSLIYQTDVQGRIGSPGDVQRYSITLDPGQSFSALVESDSGLQADVSVSGPGVTAQKAASGPGSAVLIQGLWTPGALTAGTTAPSTYIITVKGRSGTTGGFRLAVVLNAALEAEAHDGAADDTPATAQNIDGSFVGLQGVRTQFADGQPGRRAVLGALSYSGGDVDYYRVDLKRGQSATIVLVNTNGANVNVALIGPGGATLALGVESSGGSVEAISNFFATADGTYYLQVTGYSGATYALVVTQSAAFDVEVNDSIEAAQDLIGPEVGGRRWAMGAITPTNEYAASAQSYTFEDISGTGNAILQGSDDGQVLLSSADLSGFQFTSFGLSIHDIVVSANGYVFLDPIVAYGTAVYAMARDLVVYGEDAAVYWQVLGAGDDQRLVIQWSNVGFYSRPEAGSITFEMVLKESDGSIQFNYLDLQANGPDFDEGHYATVGLYGYPNGVYSSLFLDTSNVPNEFVGTEKSTRLAPRTSSDFYRINASGGATLEIETSLPAAKSGEFANGLDPVIRLYDSAGNLVASNDNGESDHRNAKLTYKVPKGAAGAYYVEVGAAGSTAGEYVVSVKQASVQLPPFIVSAINPADGSRVHGPVGQFTIDFNDVVLLTTLQASDVRIDGISATSYAMIDGDTAVFTIGQTLTDGVHSVTITAGALTDVQGTPIGAFSSSFYNDVVAPTVVSTSIQEGDVVSPGDLTVTIVFSEAMNRSNLDVYDMYLFGRYANSYHYATSLAYDDTGTVLTIRYTGLPEDAYTLVLYGWAFQDTQGWYLDGETPNWPIPPNESGDGYEGGDFVVDFSMDAATRALPTPVPVDPAGSLISQTPFDAQGTLTPAYDVDDWTIDLTAGSTVTVLVTGVAWAYPAFAPVVELFDPANNLVAVATAGDGQTAILQTVPVLATGTYTIRVAAAGDEAGLYTVRAIVNAAVEEESVGAGSNNEIATAQDIDSSFIDVAPSETRGAVIGRSGDDDVYSFHLDAGDSARLGLVGRGAYPPPLGTISYVDTGAYYLLNEAAGDLNGDSYADLVVTSSGLSIMLGNGDGTFRAPVLIVPGTGPQAVAIGDVTGDGLADLVVAYNSGSVWVLPGDGDGGFADPLVIDGLPSIVYVATADLDGDGLLDIVTTSFDAGSVSVLLNDGGGSFTRNDYAAGYYPLSVSIADVNDDTIPDLVVGNDHDATSTYGAVSVLLGDGSGGFGAPTMYSTGGGYSVHTAVADFNGDGLPDIAASNFSSGSVSVLMNNGDGTFGTPTLYGLAGYAGSIAAADMNGDGKPDVVVAGYYGVVSVLLNLGDGALGSPYDVQATYGTYGGQALAIADFNGDGLPDVSVPYYYISYVVVLINQSYLPTLELLDADGDVLASGVAGSEGLDLAIAGFTAPADGVYYVRVGGHGQKDYSLVVTRNTDLGGKTRPVQTASQSTDETAEALSGLGLSAAPDGAEAAVAAAVVGLAPAVGRSHVGASRVTGTGVDYVDRAIDSLAVMPPSRPSTRAATKTPAVRSPAVARSSAAPRSAPWKRSSVVPSRQSSVTA